MSFMVFATGSPPSNGSTYAIYMTLDVLMPSEWGFGIVKDLGFVSQMMEIFSISYQFICLLTDCPIVWVTSSLLTSGRKYLVYIAVSGTHLNLRCRLHYNTFKETVC